MSQVDAVTLDIVALLFDQLFDDPKIPIALKGLIGHLQLPMLKVAIADKELFSSKTHPARQLLDVLGQIGVRLPADFGAENPLFPRLEKFIRELVDGFQVKMIPGLLKRLKTGVTASGIDDAVSTAFFAELMKCHQEVIQGAPAAQSATESMTKSPVAKAAATESMTKRPSATESMTKKPAA